ncbi:hypothetical protein ABFS82_13G065100 [Erythranthe guttata]|uniref:Uncharacterized protein n=1 Tax=Erythranthe guttata TaxID=4155 RepID=A0A022QSU0_ERYGU|nr:PREDICTED: uncharacterized protein LOC105966757 isoform X1 [Erythranthe guttata]EYU29530.1 hypothetical protein MIMGU_mgv1a024938mg [Erythranthe guttata]|eukprot:XP_012846790.1 PREDICTED: uncharacterized protein LOC105966757 isoform X1 [Erythranthe guttata]
MGQGEETKTREEPTIQIQERGEIFFFYRPKVGKEEAHGAEDVQRLYLVLRPESGFEEKQDDHYGKEGVSKRSASEDEEDDDGAKEGGGAGCQKVDIVEKQPLLRLIVMGRKSLPQPAKKSTPYWGFVEMVTTQIQHLKAALQGEEYETRTRGHRHLPDSRAVGEGVYRILRHTGKKGMHTHLIYKLKFPAEEKVRHGEEDDESSSSPQEALNIAQEASFIIQIKSPDQHKSTAGRLRGLDNKRKAAFPAHLQGLFGHQRYHPADPPDFLNYEGCEFLLISASDDIEQELGLDLKTEHEEEYAQCSDLLETFGDDVASDVFTRPLFEATWA